MSQRTHQTARGPRFALRPISLAACLLGAAPASFGLPQGAVANGGQASVSLVSPTQMQINQTTPRAGLDWTSFSIAAGERVNVTQPSAHAVLINRVVGNDASQIHGALSSNGQVWLVNPRGVYFGPGSQVDVGGLVATTLAIGPHDITTGRLQLGSPNADAGELRAEGSITASDGSVLLVAPRLLQSGRVQARRVGLAAASEVLVDVEGDGLIFFNARNDRLDARLSVLGNVLADGGSAEVRAAARAGFADTVLNLEGVVRARSLGQRNGQIVVDGGSDGITRVAGIIDAAGTGSGQTGGDVLVLGHKVMLDTTAVVDVSAGAGGGRIRVGGGYQGNDAPLRNSEMVVARAGSRVSADATTAGNGGQVVLWADGATRFHGTVSARGGAAGGDGGNVEVSGKQWLDFKGSVDIGASAGIGGTLLLDPVKLTIRESSPDINGAGVAGTTDLASATLGFTDFVASPESFITAGAVNAQLAAGAASVVLDAQDTITVEAGATAISGAGQLTLRAGNGITIARDITATNGITLSANHTAISAADAGFVQLGANLSATGGTISISNNGGTGTHRLGGDLSANSVAIAGAATLTANASWTIGAGGAVIASAIGESGGSRGIDKLGAGLLELRANNSYSGNTTVSAGTLVLGHAQAVANSAVSVASGATLRIDNVDIGAATIGIAGSGVASNGALQASGAAAALSGAVTLNANASIGGSGTLDFGGTLTGAFAVDKVDSGTLTLNAPLAHTGTTTVSQGTLALGANNRLPNAGTLVVAGGVLDIGARNDTVALVRLQGGSITGTSGVLTSTAAFDLQSGSASAILGGTAGASKTTAGNVTLSGANTYTGSTTVSAGTLALGANNVLNNAGTLVIAGGVLDIGTRNDTVALVRLQGGAIAGSTGVLTSTAAFDLQSGSASAILGGTAGASKTTTGSVTLAGANTYSGNTTASAGTLVLGHAQAVANSPVSVADGATLQIDNVNIGAATLSITGNGVADSGALQASGAAAAISGAVTLTGHTRIGGSGTLAFNGTLGGNFDLTKVGTGTVSVNTALGHTGITTVGQGTLALGADNVLPNAGTLVVSGGVLDIGTRSDAVTLARLQAGTISGAGGTLTSSTAFDLQSGSVSAALGGTAGAVKTTAGSVTLAGANSYSGTTAVNQGTLVLGHAQAVAASPVTIADGATLQIDNVDIGAVTLSIRGSGVANNGALQGVGAGAALGGAVTLANHASIGGSGTLAFNGTLGGNFDLTKVDTGTLNVNTPLAHTGTTTVNQGTLALGANDVLPNAGTLVVSGGVFNVGTRTDTVALVRLQGGSIAGSGGALTSSAAFDLQSGSASAILAGAAGAAKTGAGTVTLSGANTYGGTTTVSAGTLALGANDVLADGTTLLVSGGVFDVGIRSDTVAQVRLHGGAINGAGGTLTSAAAFDLQSGSASASLGGNAGAAKTTAGSVTLSGANSYSGATAVSQGTLVLGHAQAVAASPVSVAGGATLAISNVNVGAATVSIEGSGVAGNGALQGLGAGAAFGGALTLSNHASIGGSGTLGFNGTLNGAFNLDKVDTGTLTVNSALNHGGTTTVSNGTLALGANNVLPDAGTVIAAGGVLNIGTRNDTVALLRLQGGAVSGTTGALTSAATFDLQSGSASAILAGNAGAAKTGAGTVTLSGANTYGGSTTVSAGTLGLGANNVLADGSTLLVNGGSFDIGTRSDAVALVQLHGGTISGSTGVLTSNAAFDLQSGSASAILGGSNGAAKSGAGTVTLSGANSYTGTTSVTSGTLALGANNVLADTGTLDVLGGGTLDIGTRSDLVASVRLLGGTVTGSTGVLSSSAAFDLQSGSVSAALGGTTGAAKTTAGTVTLSGANTYGGTTTVSAGTLAVGAGNVLADASTLTVAGGVFDIGAHNDTVAVVRLHGGTITGTTGVLSSSAAFDLQSGNASARLGGSAGAAKTTAGTVVLSGANTYSGSTTVSDGTLALGANNVLADAGTLAVAGGVLDIGTRSDTVAVVRLQGGTIIGTSGVLTSTAAFDLQSGNASAVLGGSAGASKSTGGSVTLTAANTYTGATTVSAGTLALGADHVLADVSSLNVAGGVLDIGTRSETVALVSLQGGAITGSSGVLTSTAAFDLQSGSASAIFGGSAGAIKTGAGSVTLSGTNTYSGSTTVSGGTLALGASNVLPDAGTLVIAGGVLDIGTRNETAALVQLQGGSINGSTGVLTSVAAFDLQSGSASAILGGTAGANKTTAGSVTLSGTHTYSGSTTVSAGTLALGADNVLPDAGTLVIAGGVFDVGTRNDTVALVRLQGGSIAGTTGVLTSTAAFDLQSGSASAILGGTAGANKTTAGSVTLSGADTYTGTTTVSQGTLSLGASNVLANGSSLLVAGGAFDIGSHSDTVALVSLQGGTITGTTGVLTSTASLDLQSGSASATLGGTAGASKTTAGSVTLSGANTYTGSTTVSAGTLALGADNVLADSSTLVVAGGVFDIGTRNDSVALVRLHGGTITGSTGVLGSTAAFDLQSGNVTAILGGTAGAHKTTAGSVTLSRSNTYRGSTTVSAGTLGLGASNVLADASSLVLGGGVFDIGSHNDTVAGISLQGGTVTGTSGVLTSTAALDLQSGTAAAVLGGSAGAAKTTAGSVILSAANTYSGTTTVSQGTLVLGADNVLADAGTLAVAGGVLDIGTRSDTVAVVRLQGGTIVGTTGVLTSSAAFDLQSGSAAAILGGNAGATKTTAGTVTLTAANTYTGTTTVSAGTLALGADNVLADTGSLNVAGGVLDIGARNQTVALVSLQGGTIAGTSGVLTSIAAFDLQSGSASATLGGSAGLIKTGAGSVTLSGTHTYSGSTTINAGTLALGADNVLPDAGTLVIAGGVLDIGTRNETVALVQLQGGTITGSTGVLTSSAAFDLQSGSASAILGGSAGANKTTAGSVTLSGPHIYSGSTTVSAGTLALGADNVLPDAGTLVIAGGVFDVGTRNDTVALVRLQGGSIAGTTGVLTSTAAFDLQSGSASAILGGTAGANKTTAGSVTLSGANTYTGTTTVSQGTLGLGASNVLANGSSLLVAAGVFDVGSHSDTVALVSLQGGTITGTTGVLTSTAPFDLQSGSASAILGGTAGASKTTAGSVTLSGANTYTGSTTVSAGTLTFATSDVLGDASIVDVLGGTLDIADRNETVAQLRVHNGTVTGTTGVLTAGTYTLTGARVDALLGSGSLVSDGSTTLNANAAVQHIEIAGGTLTLNRPQVLTASPAVLVTAGTLALAADQTIGTLRGGGAVDLGSFTLATGSGGASVYDGALSGSGTLLKQGAGTTFTLAGNNLHARTRVAEGTLALSGPQRLSDGSEVQVDRDASLQLSAHENIGRLVLLGNLTLAANPAAGTALTAADYLLDGGTVRAPLGSGSLVSTGASHLHADVAAGSTLVSSGSLTLHRAQQLAAALPAVTVAGGAVLALAQDQTIGTLSGSGETALGSFTLATGAAGDSSYAGLVSGIGTLQKDGAATSFTLTGNTTHARTRVTGGVLQLSDTGHLADSAEVLVERGGVLRLAADETIGQLTLAGQIASGAAAATLHADNYQLDGGTVDSALGAGALTSTGPSTLNATSAAGIVTVTAGQLTLGAPQRLTGLPLLTVEPGAVLRLDGNDTAARLVLRGQLAGGGMLTAADYALQGGRADARLGAGMLTSTGNSTLAADAAVGDVRVLSGTLELAGAQRLSALPAVTVERDAAVKLAADQTFGTLAGAGSVDLQGFTLASGAGGASTFDGVISGDGGLVKRGASVFTLRGANSYRGRTAIEEGTLRVGNDDTAGAIGSGDVVVTGTLATLAFARSDTVTLNHAVSGSGNVHQDGSGRLVLAGNNKTHTGRTRVNRGTLATASADNLSDGSAVAVAAGAGLVIGGNEAVQSLDLDTAGQLSLAGNLQAGGDLLLRGAVTVTGNLTINLSGARIDAVNPGNRWGAALGFDARDRITLSSGIDGASQRPLTLAAFSAAAGGRIDAGQTAIGANGLVSGGQLVIASDVAQTAATSDPPPPGKLVQSRPVAYSADAIVQGPASRLEVGADAELSLLTPNGASIQLGRLDNRFSGRVSAIAGNATAPWAINDAGGVSLQNRVRIGGDTVNVGGAGVIGDVVEINADTLATRGDAALVARLPFDRDVGTTVSLPALTLILTQRSFTLTFPYGNAGVEGLRVNVGSRSWGLRTAGPDAGYITVLPRGGGTSGNTSVLLVGPSVNAGGYGFFFDGASVQGEVPVYYNGVLPATPQVENSLSATVAVSEAARKQRFDEAVRTENVALRLRAGVIAEVGPAPSATQGPEGARLPASCPPAAGTLDCAAKP